MGSQWRSGAARQTLFVAGARNRGRKAWLAGRLTARGRIAIDEGAAKALRGGNSLLAAGAISVEGMFTRGDVVEVVDGSGGVLARGLSEYDASDAARIAGRRSDVHAGLLGYAPRAALIHRDHLVLV